MQHIRLLFLLSQLFVAGLFGSLSVQAQYQYQWQVGSQGAGEAQFNGSFGHGVAVDEAGTIYVADGENNRIQKFNNSGRFRSAFGSYGTENGQFYTPVEVNVDGAGNVYVVEWNNHRVQKFDSTGQFITTFGRSGTSDERLSHPTGAAVDAEGNVYVADGDNNDRVLKFNSSGQFVLKFGSRGTGDGQFNAPSAVAVDGSGDIYVSDHANNRIQKFNGNGQFISAFGSSGGGDGQFNHPNGIAIDGAGNIYVSEWNGNRIQKFNSSGQFLLKLNAVGSGDGQFNRPDGVAVDRSGNVYVYDALNYRVQKFAPVPCSSLPLTPGTLPEGTIGTVYSVAVNGAPAGYTYSATGLPDGLSINSAGVISGTPTAVTDSPASVTVTARFYDCSQTVNYLLKINKSAATVSIANTLQTYSGRAHPVAVTTIPTGLPVSLTYNGDTVLPTGAGSYAVAATVTSPHYAGSASATLTIEKAPLLVKADDLSREYGNPNPPLTLTYTGFVNGEAGRVIDTPPFVSTTATQSSKAGTYPIVLSGGSDDNYALTLQNGTMTVTKLSQAINFTALPAKTFGDAPFPLLASATSGLAVAFRSSNPAVATISGNMVTITGAGTVALTASQRGDDMYGAATSVSQTLLVAKADQEISFAALAEKRETDAPFSLLATTSSGLPVSFEVVAGPATLSGNTLTITGAGRVTIKAAQEGNANYSPALPVCQSFCANPVQPVITAHGVTLHSSSKHGNQWHLNGELLNGETKHILVVRTTGSYTVAVTASCGVTAVSETFLVTTNPIAEAGTLYPNPAIDQVALELPQGMTWHRAIVVDANGQEVTSKQDKDKNSIVFDLSTLQKGVYFIEAQTNRGIIRHKFLIQ